MAFYMDAKRIPPERLMDRPPQQYDRILQTFDIDGARSKVKRFQPEDHQNTLKTSDIAGAQPKKQIRNIWGKYDYNPVEKNLSIKEDINAKKLPQIEYPAGMNMNQPKSVRNQRQSSLNNIMQQQKNPQTSEDKNVFLNQKRHIQPQSQIQSQRVLNPSKVLQPYLDYDKVVQPYEKPQRDQEMAIKHQQQMQQQEQMGKNADIPQKQDEYRQTHDKINQYNSQNVDQLANQQREQQQFQNNYEAFYRGYTPTEESIKQYPQTKNMLENKAQSLSSQAQLAQKNLVQPNYQQYQDQQQNQIPNQQSIDPQQQQPPQYQQQPAQYQQQPPQYEQQPPQYQQQPPQYQQQPPQYQQQPPQYQQQPPQYDQQYQQQQPQGNNYDQPPPASQRRQMIGSQSVQNIPQSQLGQQKSWDNYQYNLVGGYIQNKRSYLRDKPNILEKQYYNDYDVNKAENLRKTQNIPNKPFSTQVPHVPLDRKQVDHNDLQYINEVEKRISDNHGNNKFGRSQLFDELQMKPNIASHQKQFIGNIVSEPLINKPQRYGPKAVGNLSNNLNDD